MGTVGQVTCTFTINSQPFTQSFIVCRHNQLYWEQTLHPRISWASFCCVAPLWLLSLNPFTEFRICNNSSSSDVLYIQASISISPSMNPNQRQQVTVIYCFITAQMLQYSIY